MCRVLDVSPSGYYSWRGRGRSRRAQRDEELRGRIRTIHEDSRGVYGMPRAPAELVDQGCRVGRKRVARLMREQGLAGVSRHRDARTTRPEPGRRAAPDLVQRRFEAQAPDRLWVADITPVSTGAGSTCRPGRGSCSWPWGSTGVGRPLPRGLPGSHRSLLLRLKWRWRPRHPFRCRREPHPARDRVQ